MYIGVATSPARLFIHQKLHSAKSFIVYTASSVSRAWKESGDMSIASPYDIIEGGLWFQCPPPSFSSTLCYIQLLQLPFVLFCIDNPFSLLQSLGSAHPFIMESILCNTYNLWEDQV